MTQADHIIELFGGITSLSRILGHRHPSTVQGWKARGLVPAKHHQHLINVGREQGINVTPEDFFIESHSGPPTGHFSDGEAA